MTVKLRTKKISDGRISYFLLYYNPVDRQRRKEYLSLYTFIKPKDELEKHHNKETKALAEKIHAKQLLENQEGRFGFDSKRKIEIPFLAYSSWSGFNQAVGPDLRQRHPYGAIRSLLGYTFIIVNLCRRHPFGVIRPPLHVWPILN